MLLTIFCEHISWHCYFRIFIFAFLINYLCPLHKLMGCANSLNKFRLNKKECMVYRNIQIGIFLKYFEICTFDREPSTVLTNKTLNRLWLYPCLCGNAIVEKANSVKTTHTQWNVLKWISFKKSISFQNVKL